MENSSEVWSGFRVAKRAVPFNIQVHSIPETDNKISFQASHNGYLRLKNKAIHTRKFNLSNNELSFTLIIFSLVVLFDVLFKQNILPSAIAMETKMARN